MLIAAMLICFSTPSGAQAQESKAMNVVSGNFGQGALMVCSVLPEDNQGSGCWIYNKTENYLGYHHPDGVGPTIRWPFDHGVELTNIGASDDGRFMIMVLKSATSTTIEVHTLLRPKWNQRLAGISTPRAYFRILANGAQAASVTEGNNLIVAFSDMLKVYEMRPKVYLPSVSSNKKEVAPTPSACDEDPDCPGTPVVLPPGPRDTPEPVCQGLSSDPPWCAKRTPEPCEEGPNCATPPAIATARP